MYCLSMLVVPGGELRILYTENINTHPTLGGI